MNETTLFLAKIASAYLVITGLGFLISTEFYEKMVRDSANTDPVTVNLSGAVHFLVGLSILLQHFRWGSPIEMLVTLLGLAATIKGAGLIILPEVMLRSPKTQTRSLKFSGIGFIALGVYLGYLSYI